jgi:hypothetical protein
MAGWITHVSIVLEFGAPSESWLRTRLTLRTRFTLCTEIRQQILEFALVGLWQLSSSRNDK